MSNQRARVKTKVKWNYEQYGCFGMYACADSLPIEFISTTMQVSELSNLTYAKDIRTELDFELLIQRDIDEKRAIEQISKYISPENGSGYGTIKNNGVFLPPLVVAVVGTNDGKTLANSYPDSTTLIEEDDYGRKFITEWEDLFKVTMFEQSKGMNYCLGKDEVEVDSKNVHIEFFLGQKNEGGGRLVVIDGQHRLFALNYLRNHSEHKDKIKNLVIPVCILYSPTSTLSEVQKSAPRIPDVLRKLFVDVNNNAKTVSGHFKILLSDDDIGKLACSSFCTSLLDKEFFEGKTLGLIEWNTKTDKESKTISKPYSLSSIGVIYDTLADLFRTRNGKEVLRRILNINEIEHKLDFGLDEDGAPKPQSVDFPWRDIPYKNKNDLKAQVDKYLTPCLQKIFFETGFYKDFVDLFFEARRLKLETLTKERNTKSKIAEAVLEYLDEFTEVDDKPVDRLLGEFVDSFLGDEKIKIHEITRTNVFQKAILTAWFTFMSKLLEFKLSPVDITSIFVIVLEKSVASNLFVNSLSNLYLQDSIYDGIKIKPSVESRKQIARLITATLGDNTFANSLAVRIKDFDNSLEINKLVETLQKLGGDNATFYANSLHATRIKEFTKSYRSNTELSALDIQNLMEYEENKNVSIKAKRKDSNVKVDNLFDEKVKEYINLDFKLSIDQLSDLLGVVSVFDEFLLEESSEE